MDELFLTQCAGQRRHRHHTVIRGYLSPERPPGPSVTVTPLLSLRYCHSVTVSLPALPCGH